MPLVREIVQRITANVSTVIIGKQREIQLTIIGLLCRGHILIEDVPGVGKTMMAKALARSMGCTFSRIQFTPDMLPSDVTGATIYNQNTGKFEFRRGPVFAQIVLTDEINRATPKTQSALLEAMEERQVTVDGATYDMPQPFLVLATQNPIEYEGTFPLPEAQLDRFLLRIQLGYPGPADEIAMLDTQQYAHPLDVLAQVVSAGELQEVQEAIKDVFVAPELKTYMVELVNATRRHPEVYLGASPRGTLALRRCAQASAAAQGRDYVMPDDVKALATAVLAHRIIVSPDARIRDITARSIVRSILSALPVPGAAVGAR
ncbi:MAG: MoxR family ATPase [Anaerolineae bacterium]|nr:MoxR family ATPase [Anaerolineae bacterium]